MDLRKEREVNNKEEIVMTEKFAVLVRLENGFRVQACVIFRLECSVVLPCKPLACIQMIALANGSTNFSKLFAEVIIT